MTGQDFLDKVSALVVDMQTKGKGMLINILFRSADGSPNILRLAANEIGDVVKADIAALNQAVDPLAAIADDYTTFSIPVSAASEVFKTATIPHQPLIDAASAARLALSDALLADPVYQTAKMSLDEARADESYIQAVNDYRVNNVSENFGELTNAKGKYVPFVDGSGFGTGGGGQQSGVTP